MQILWQRFPSKKVVIYFVIYVNVVDHVIVSNIVVA